MVNFTRFVQVGRVVLINYGDDAGKLATIMDIVDQRRVLIDAPSNTGVSRQIINLNRVSLTDIVVTDITKTTETRELTEAWKTQNVSGTWTKSKWAQKLAAKAKRSKTSDFARFKVMVAKKQRSKLIAAKM